GVMLHTARVHGPVLYFDENGSVGRKKRSWVFGYPRSGSSRYELASSENSAVPQRWVHIAGVWDGQTARLFVDGKPVSSKGAQPSPWPQMFDVYLGKHYGKEHPGLSFNGLLDEIRISKVARYTKNFTPEKRFTPDKNTLALYHFDEGSGDVLKDSSGNGHHGKIHGAAWVNADGSVTKP
ncbi:MAG: LamG domain-containing protein, partial [Planctomycetaceae bacterium]